MDSVQQLAIVLYMLIGCAHALQAYREFNKCPGERMIRNMKYFGYNMIMSVAWFLIAIVQAFAYRIA